MGLFDVSVEDGKVIKVTIASGSEKPYYIKKNGMTEKGCYLRVGSSAEPMPLRMIEDLFSKRTRNSIGKIESPINKLTLNSSKSIIRKKANSLTTSLHTISNC